MPEVPAVPGAGALNGDAEALGAQVAEAFADGGPLARALPAFEPRPGQREMAAAASDVLAGGGVLLAEAGTGTGKTLAYLVPAILSGRRVLISTGTKNLQDQIFHKDVPALRSALDVPFTAAYMKGRGNYLCLHRFETVGQGGEPRAAAEQAYVAALREWAAQTETGDRAEVEDLPDDFPLWQEISAASENCIGQECPRHDDCFVTRMRRQALESDLVIVNHHLLCADAAVRQSAYGEVIPACACTVIDEAHQLEDVATQYFGVAVSNYRLEELVRDGRRLLDADPAVEQAAGDDLRERLERTREQARTFTGVLLRIAAAGDRLRVDGERLAPAAEPARGLERCLADVASGCAGIKDASEDLQALARRANELRDQLRFLLAAGDDDFVYFLERRGRGVFLRASPIDVSGVVGELILARAAATILTSATMTVDDTFDYLRGRLGVREAHELRLPSEFDFATQAVLFLPREMPDPRSGLFTAAMARELAGLLRATAGRAFVLFTSYANLREVHYRLAAALPYPLLVQGSAPRTVLLREFRSTPQAVLLATSSFWQGVDVVGDALSCVVIDKLPFASPGDPITAARMEAVAARGGNPFADYQVPLAILTLLQGLGRLIRHRRDRGVLALFDARVRTKSYGRRFLASLPPAPITHEIDAVRRFLDGPAEPPGPPAAEV